MLATATGVVVVGISVGLALGENEGGDVGAAVVLVVGLSLGCGVIGCVDAVASHQL